MYWDCLVCWRKEFLSWYQLLSPFYYKTSSIRCLGLFYEFRSYGMLNRDFLKKNQIRSFNRESSISCSKPHVWSCTVCLIEIIWWKGLICTITFSKLWYVISFLNTLICNRRKVWALNNCANFNLVKIFWQNSRPVC